MKRLERKRSELYKRHQAARQEKLRREFLPEALEIVEKPVSPVGHAVLFIVVAVILLFFIWAIFGRMDEVITARGKIITTSGVQEVKAINGGMVEQICVKEGDHVSAGQPIVYLDSSAQEIMLQNNSQSLELLEYENKLLKCAQKGKSISRYLKGEQDDNKIRVLNYVQAIQKDYQSQKEELEESLEQAQTQVKSERQALEKKGEQKSILQEQKKALNAIMEESKEQEQTTEKLEQEISYREEEVADYQALYSAGAITKAEMKEKEQELEQLNKEYEIQKTREVYEDYDNSLRTYELDNQLIGVERDYSSQENAVALAEQQCSQAEKKLETLEADYEVQISGLIMENEDKISAQKSDKEIQAISVKEQVLVSPVDGTIKTLEIETEGGVLTSAEIAATIIPDGKQMLAEVEIINQDVGYIQVGQDTAMKLDTYNFQKYGKLDGKIVSISPDAVWNDRKGWVYMAKISLDEKRFQKKNPDTKLSVGMEVTTEIKVSSRRIIEFFLEPIVEHFDGSLNIL